MTAPSLQAVIQSKAYRIVRWQLIGIVLLSMITAVFFGLKNGYSFLAGGMIYGVANLVFVWAVFRFVGAHQMTQFMIAFFFGEMLKLFFSAVLFLVIVKTLSVSLLSALAGLFGAMVVFWIVSFWQFSRPNKMGRSSVVND